MPDRAFPQALFLAQVLQEPQRFSLKGHRLGLPFRRNATGGSQHQHLTHGVSRFLCYFAPSLRRATVTSVIREPLGGKLLDQSRRSGVLLFHTEEPIQQFYRDGFDLNGMYWYSSQGSYGDMEWDHYNRAVRDHAQYGWDLLFFERAQREGGLWRFANTFYSKTHKIEDRPDKAGNMRSAIIFGLLPAFLRFDRHAAGTPHYPKTRGRADYRGEEATSASATTWNRFRKVFGGSAIAEIGTDREAR